MVIGAQPLLLVGAGKMGSAMLERWIERGLESSEVTILDPYLEGERWAELARVGVATATSVTAAADRAYKIVVLAVKPQSMAEALAQVRPLATRDTTIVSIAAGVRLAKLEAAFPQDQPVVRAMPNTPAQVGMSMSVAVANQHVADVERGAVDALLSAIGKVAWTDDESLLDAVTAVSGSGPAYVFLLAEALAEAGRKAGLPKDLAALLARQTVAGAGVLLARSPLSPDVLRKHVTSPAGTTEAALRVLMSDDGLQPLMDRAVDAAKKRSTELG
ncbi:MAG TPA: pyrroline-5-carboxylate reductase [Planctomycetota bacterium]|nr:pyrroline-5-carboxylate reductase [Planctomycetota bacterium]